MKKVEYSGTSTNHLLNHAWNYSSIDGTMLQLFNLQERQNHKKMGAKNDLQKRRKMELYDIYNGVFHKIFRFFKMK